MAVAKSSIEEPTALNTDMSFSELLINQNLSNSVVCANATEKVLPIFLIASALADLIYFKIYILIRMF